METADSYAQDLVLGLKRLECEKRWESSRGVQKNAYPSSCGFGTGGYEIHSWKVMLWESEKRDLGAWTKRFLDFRHEDWRSF